MLNWIIWNRTVYMYKINLAFNNQLCLICHKTKPKNIIVLLLFCCCCFDESYEDRILFADRLVCEGNYSKRVFIEFFVAIFILQKHCEKHGIKIACLFCTQFLWFSSKWTHGWFKRQILQLFSYIYIYIYIYIHSVSQKWVQPSHFCRYLSISLHGTTLTKWHFGTMKSSLCAAYITELIHFLIKITINITIKS